MDQQMLRKMQKLQKDYSEKAEVFADQKFTLEKQGIEIVMKGNKKMVSIKIKDEILIDPEDPETLEDLIVLTINELENQIDEEQEKLMPNLPAGFGF
ncbi:YbaB/EbfC family nucleoid-associated protein [Mycoplasmopsis opalescens]|uniref:YbaB/EbfC family nucleoid-associated protein n=1 Tax=Mycoplasmopsis opalescens TaxID=114886 RepID=UPI0004A7546D|nr:YbaB/EbfC family nucleoid-associated protein [Mycoplasmopsis opalescens]